MQRWRTRAVGTYIELTEEFLVFLKERASDPSEIEDMLLVARNIVKNDPAKQIEACQTWCDNMFEPLSKKVRYARALDRILQPSGGGAIVAHAVAYHDVVSLCASSTSPSFRRLQLDAIVAQPNWTDDDTSLMWKYIDDINRAAFEACEKPLPSTPSREEISRNIRSHKKTDGHTTIQQAFYAAVGTLCESRATLVPPDADMDKLKAELSAMCQGQNLRMDALESRDAETLARLRPLFKATIGLDVAEPSDADGRSCRRSCRRTWTRSCPAT